MNQTSNKKKMEFPRTLVIILIMIVLVAILAYLAQAGQYDRIEAVGRKVVDPPSYHTVPANRVTPFDIFVAIPAGMQVVAGVASMVLIIGDSPAVIKATGVTRAILVGMSKMGGHPDAALLPTVIVTLSLPSAFTDSVENMLAFVPLGIFFARTPDSDAMVGLSIIIATGNAGSASELFNTMIAGVVQTLLGIELFSGLWYHAIGYGLLLCSVSFWTVWYTLKLRKNPTRSCCYNVELAAKEKTTEASEIDSEATPRRVLVLIEFIAGIAFITYGTLDGWDSGPELDGVFLIVAVVCGLTGGFNGNQVCDESVEGTKKILVSASVVGFAEAIDLVMDQACISDTIVYALSNLLSDMPRVVGTLLMYIFQIIADYSITSGSGQAAITIPIMEPLGDVLDLTLQTVVTTSISGDGLTNLLLPMSAATMGAVAVTGISYGQYTRYIWRIVVTNLCLGGVMVVIAAMIGL